MLSAMNASGGHGSVDWEIEVLWRNDLESKLWVISEKSMKKVLEAGVNRTLSQRILPTAW